MNWQRSSGFSPDRIQQRTVEQTIPATQGRTQHTHVQHVVNTVEVERPKIIKQAGQKTSIQEKINQVTKHVEVPLLQVTDKVIVDCCVGRARSTVASRDGDSRNPTVTSLVKWSMSLLCLSCCSHWCRCES